MESKWHHRVLNTFAPDPRSHRSVSFFSGTRFSDYAFVLVHQTIDVNLHVGSPRFRDGFPDSACFKDILFLVPRLTGCQPFLRYSRVVELTDLAKPKSPTGWDRSTSFSRHALGVFTTSATSCSGG